MRQSISILSSVLTGLILAGCGGGGGGGDTSSTTTSISTATFIDSAVSGLEFESSAGSGLTDSNGNFIYKEGDSVTFHIGNLYIGNGVPQNGKVTPLEVIGTQNISDGGDRDAEHFGCTRRADSPYASKPGQR